MCVPIASRARYSSCCCCRLLVSFLLALARVCVYRFRYFRIGILVLISMDICDVFLHSMKMLRFYDVRHPINTPVWVRSPACALEVAAKFAIAHRAIQWL